MFKHTLTTLLLPLAALAGARAADFYVEPRVSVVAISGTLNIGDLGRKTESDVSPFAPGLGLGFHLTPRLAVEARYTRIARFTQSKESADVIFPTDQVILPFVRTYDLSQRTDLFALAVPFTAVTGNRFSLQLTPILHFATANLRLQETFDGVIAAVFPPIFQPLLVERTDQDVRLGGELAVAYKFTATTCVKLHYTYAPLRRVDAHLFGLSAEVRF